MNKFWRGFVRVGQILSYRRRHAPGCVKENKDAGGRFAVGGQPGERAIAMVRAKESRKPEGKIPEWWREVPAAEKAVLRDVMRSIRGLKCSRSKLVVQAARKRERGITCFIKVRLMGERPRRRTEG